MLTGEFSKGSKVNKNRQREDKELDEDYDEYLQGRQFKSYIDETNYFNQDDLAQRLEEYNENVKSNDKIERLKERVSNLGGDVYNSLKQKRKTTEGDAFDDYQKQFKKKKDSAPDPHEDIETLLGPFKPPEPAASHHAFSASADYSVFSWNIDYRLDNQTYSPPTENLGLTDYDLRPYFNAKDENQKLPVIRIFGVDADGYNACFNVYGFMPYFIVNMPTVWKTDLRKQYDLSELKTLGQLRKDIHNNKDLREKCKKFCDHLNLRFADCAKDEDLTKFKETVKGNLIIADVQPIISTDIYGHNQADFYLKIFTCSPTFVTKVRDYMSFCFWDESIKSFTCDIVYRDNHNITKKERPPRRLPRTHETPFQIYEANVRFAHRFMIDMGIRGVSWYTLKKGEYSVSQSKWDKLTYCPFEGYCHYSSIIARDPSNANWKHLPPLRTLTFDIECRGKDARFPLPEEDPVICIVAYLDIEGGGDKGTPPDKHKKHGEHTASVALTFGTCSTELLKKKVSDIIVLNHVKHGMKSLGNDKDGHIRYQYKWDLKDEFSLGMSFHALMTKYFQPHMIDGWNIDNFDIPYLVNRMYKLSNYFGTWDNFSYLGFVKREKSKLRISNFESKAYGKRETSVFQMPGRVSIDGLAVVRREIKCRHYNLGYISQELLGETKVDLSHKLIGPYWDGNQQCDEKRELVVNYCDTDVVLTRKIRNKRFQDKSIIALSQAAGIPPEMVHGSGACIRTISKLLRKSRQRDEFFIVPNFARDDTIMLDQGESYEGATVVDPEKGYYDQPVVTLDFSSLYPSIMIFLNLCYSTWLVGGGINMRKLTEFIQKYGAENVETTPKGGKFVKKNVRLGVLVEILIEGLADRDEAKDMLKKAKAAGKKDEEIHYDQKQLALKILNNSVYGFTGAKFQLPCTDISEGVTSYGRISIDKTIDTITKEFNLTVTDKQEDGKEVKVLVQQKIIYGDTDSVMVWLKNLVSIAAAIEYGKFAAKYVTEHCFEKPMCLTFEKVYCPFLLVEKKRYSGLFWTKPDKPDKIDTKGLESVRRDNCPLVSNTLKELLRLLLDRKPKDAFLLVERIIDDIYMDRIGISQYVISKAFSKEVNQYKAPQAHIKLVEKLRQRGSDSSPRIGDRISFVIIAGDRNQKICERAEEPLFVINNKLPIDKDYYLKAFETSMSRIIEPLQIGITDALFRKMFPGDGGLIKVATIDSYFTSKPREKPSNVKVEEKGYLDNYLDYQPNDKEITNQQQQQQQHVEDEEKQSSKRKVEDDPEAIAKQNGFKKLKSIKEQQEETKKKEKKEKKTKKYLTNKNGYTAVEVIKKGEKVKPTLVPWNNFKRKLSIASSTTFGSINHKSFNREVCYTCRTPVPITIEYDLDVKNNSEEEVKRRRVLCQECSKKPNANAIIKDVLFSIYSDIDQNSKQRCEMSDICKKCAGQSYETMLDLCADTECKIFFKRLETNSCLFTLQNKLKQFKLN